MSYNDLNDLEPSERFPDRFIWIFVFFFLGLIYGFILFKNMNPINAIIIHTNLDGYREVTFKATRVIEIKRSKNGRTWIADRQLVGELRTESKWIETGFVAGRQLEKIYNLENGNTPDLNTVSVGKTVNVLYSPAVQIEAGGESLAVISADRSDHIEAFWLTLLKILIYVPWFIFCTYMWVTYPMRFEHRKELAIKRNFALRKLNRNRNAHE
jgi:hypothetical protein